MAYSVKKSAVATLTGLSVMLLLAGCSHDQHYKREVNGNEDYLNAAQLKELNVPEGMILPLENGGYTVPQAGSQGEVGKQLDIRPPQQALALVNGSRAQFQGNSGILLIANNDPGLWNQVVETLQAENIAIAQRNDAQRQLTTDWISWARADEDHQYRGRYQVSVQSQGYQQALMVRPLALEQKGTEVTDRTEIQRYTVALLNQLGSGVNDALTARSHTGDAQTGSIDVQSAADDTGLPNLIIRAPFTTTWQRLPVALSHAGFSVSDSNRAEGSLQLSYKGLSGEQLSTLGAADPNLVTGKYKLQVGDLENRSSLQFIDPKGHVLTQSQNDALVALLQAAFNK